MPDSHRLEQPDRPWVMRTYAGHSTARESIWGVVVPAEEPALLSVIGPAGSAHAVG